MPWDGFRSVAVHRSFERLRAVAATLRPELERGLADALIGAGNLPGVPNPLGPTTLSAGAAGPISLGAVTAWRPAPS